MVRSVALWSDKIKSLAGTYWAFLPTNAIKTSNTRINSSVSFWTTIASSPTLTILTRCGSRSSVFLYRIDTPFALFFKFVLLPPHSLTMPFALPCPCGNSVSVQRSQAGSTVTCLQCGKTLDVPTIRGLQALPVIEEKEGDAKSSIARPSQWNPIRGVIAVICIAIAVYTLWPAAEWGWFRYNSDYSFTLEDELREGEKIVQALTPVQAWDTWQHYQESGLLTRNPSSYFQMKEYIEVTEPTMIRYAIIGGISLLGLFAALFWPSKKQPLAKAS